MAINTCAIEHASLIDLQSRAVRSSNIPQADAVSTLTSPARHYVRASKLLATTELFLKRTTEAEFRVVGSE